jgi:hypothetical protein
LAACYEFEGNTNDSTTNHNDAASTGANYVKGRIGRAVNPDAMANILAPKSPSLDIPNAITIDAWINVTVDAPSPRAVILDNNHQYTLYLAPGGMVGCSVGDTHFIAPGNIAVDTWTHVACTYDGAQVVLWVRGVAVAATPYSAAIATNATDGMRIGANIPDGTYPGPDTFVGALDQLRVWNVALDQTELCVAAGIC